MQPSRASVGSRPAFDPGVAQQAAPGCKVAYVDNDLLVLVHARALLTSRPEGRCGYIDADLRDPAAILAQASATLDFAQPVAVLLLAILHFLPGADDPAGIVAALARALATGSYLVISHLTADFAPGQVGTATEAYNAAAPGCSAGNRIVSRFPPRAASVPGRPAAPSSHVHAGGGCPHGARLFDTVCAAAVYCPA